jgi:hypothetical protein
MKIDTQIPTASRPRGLADTLLIIAVGALLAAAVSTLVAAVTSVLIALDDNLLSKLDDGHLLVGWLALWAGVFAVLGLYGHRIADAWRGYAQRRAEQAELNRWMADARHDPRLMQELMAAIARHESEQESAPRAQQAPVARAPGVRHAGQLLRGEIESLGGVPVGPFL